MNEPKLTIELVPRTCWYSNVRSEVSPAEWEILRRRTSLAANHRCEICGGRGPKWPVECHEVWAYDDYAHHQRLERLIALCPACHQVKHLGLASIKGQWNEAIQHLTKVNRWTREEAENYAHRAFKLWDARSNHEWTFDLSYLGQIETRTGNQEARSQSAKLSHVGSTPTRCSTSDSVPLDL